MGGKLSTCLKSDEEILEASAAEIESFRKKHNLFLLSCIKTQDLWVLILCYWNFDVANIITPSAHPETQFSRYSFFGLSPLADLAKAAQFILLGNPVAVNKIIEENLSPSLLTTPVKTIDHRGYEYHGSLLQLAFARKDFFIRDENNETMAGMIQRHVEERCGIDEVKRQQAIFSVWQKASDEKYAADKIALETVWNAIATSKNVKKAIKNFQNYLRPKPNSGFVSHNPDQLHLHAWQQYERYYDEFDGFDSPKNNLICGQIINAIQVLYLTTCSYQVTRFGIYYAVRDPVVPRIEDIRAAGNHKKDDFDIRLGDGSFTAIGGTRVRNWALRWRLDIVDNCAWELTRIHDEAEAHYNELTQTTTAERLLIKPGSTFTIHHATL